MLVKTEFYRLNPVLINHDVLMAEKTNQKNIVKEIGERSIKTMPRFAMSHAKITNGRGISFAKTASVKREDWLENVKVDGELLEFAPNDFKSDRELVEIAIRKTQFAFRYASPELKQDREYLLDLFTQFPGVFKYINKELRTNADFIYEALTVNPWLLETLAEPYRDDEEIVLAAIKGICNLSDNFDVFRLASERLKSDEGFVIKVVAIDPMSLEYASEKLRNDFNVVRKAVEECVEALQFASIELQLKFLK